MITNYYEHDLLFLYKKTISIFKSHEIQSKLIKVPDKINILYCRVSSAKQKHDLQRQIEVFQKAHTDYHVDSDVCLGINFKRYKLRSLLDKFYQGLVNLVVIMHQDRLARFGFDLLVILFQKLGVKTRGSQFVLTSTSKNQKQEL